MTPNSAVFAPIPNATVRIAAAANAGFRLRERTPDSMLPEYALKLCFVF
jgi:hypothetical protein